MRTSRVAAGVVAAFTAFAVFVVTAPGRVPDRTVAIVDDLVFVGLTCAAGAFTAAAALSCRGRRRAAWWTMTAAMVAWLLGDVIWAYLEIRGRDPFPSPADIPYLTYPFLSVVALLLFPTQRSARSGARPILDGIIVAGSLFIVSWRAVLAEVYRSSGMDPLEERVSLAYPLSAVAMLTVAAVVLVRSAAGQRLTLSLLTVGLALSALASGFFSYLSALSEYGSGNLLDLGWAASAVLILIAAAVDRNADHRVAAASELVSWTSVLLPYIPLMLAAVVIAVTTGDAEPGGPVRVVALILVTAVLGRQFLADRENRRLLNTVADRATHDQLTGLANRSLLDDRLTRLLGAGSRTAVLALDLDGFKLVNDTFGHAAGNDVLVEVGQRLQACVRHGDVVARVGGDEFAVLIEGDAALAEQVAGRIRDAFRVPFAVAGRSIVIQPSIGVAVDSEDHVGAELSAEELLNRADLAMYAGRSSRPAGRPAGPAQVPDGASVSEIELMQ